MALRLERARAAKLDETGSVGSKLPGSARPIGSANLDQRIPTARGACPTATNASRHSCRAFEAVDVAMLERLEAEGQNPEAEIAVSLVEISPEGLRRGLVAGPHAIDDREEIVVDFSGVEKRSIFDRDADPGLCLIASTDEIIVG
jgi:hypothetical protein